MGKVSDRDREIARGLPDEFLRGSGISGNRVVGLVSTHWGSHDKPARAELAQALLPILEELFYAGAYVTDEHRDLCEGVVTVWLEKQ